MGKELWEIPLGPREDAWAQDMEYVDHIVGGLRRGFMAMPDMVSALNELWDKRHKLRNEEAAEILKAAKFIASRRRGGKDGPGI